MHAWGLGKAKQVERPPLFEAQWARVDWPVQRVGQGFGQIRNSSAASAPTITPMAINHRFTPMAVAHGGRGTYCHSGHGKSISASARLIGHLSKEVSGGGGVSPWRYAPVAEL